MDRGREGGGGEAAEPGVLGAFGREDGSALPVAEGAFGAGHLGDEGERRVEAAVTQDGDDVVVAGDDEASGHAGEPVLRCHGREGLDERGAVEAERVDLGKVEVVGRPGHRRLQVGRSCGLQVSCVVVGVSGSVRGGRCWSAQGIGFLRARSTRSMTRWGDRSAVSPRGCS